MKDDNLANKYGLLDDVIKYIPAKCNIKVLSRERTDILFSLGTVDYKIELTNQERDQEAGHGSWGNMDISKFYDGGWNSNMSCSFDPKYYSFGIDNLKTHIELEIENKPLNYFSCPHCDHGDTAPLSEVLKKDTYTCKECGKMAKVDGYIVSRGVK